MIKEYKCNYCEQKFKHHTDISRHYKQNKDCYSKWKQDQEIIYNSKPRIKCEICGNLLRNISNTHLRTHGITQQKYKETFPNSPIFSDGLLEIQKELREKTIKERYTTDEIKQFKGIASNKINSLPESEKNKIYKQKYEKTIQTIEKKYNTNISNYYSNNITKFLNNLKNDENAYKEYFQKRLEKSIQTNIEKYGVTFPQSLEKTKEKQKKSLIKNFGSLKNAYDIIASKSIETRFENYGRIHYCPIFSIESQNLFKSLEERLKEYNFTIYYATNGKDITQNEFQIPIKNGSVKLRFLDFYIKELNKAIEYDEEYHNTEKQILSDNIRYKEISENCPNIKIYRVRGQDWKRDKEQVIINCLNFLQNC